MALVALAAKQKWRELQEAIVAGGNANEQELTDSMHYTPILYAAYHNNKEMFSWLAQHGADVHYRDTNGKTALHVAAKYGSADVVRLLLLEGVDADVKDVWNRTASELTSDRRGAAKNVSQEQLDEVDRVFRCWSHIKPHYDEHGIDGLKQLSVSATGALADETRAYLCILLASLHARAPTDGKSEDAEPLPTDLNDVDVFISYAWSDSTAVQNIALMLRERGVRVWMNIGQFQGDRELEVLDHVIRNCKVVLASVSHKYAQSVACRREVSLANDASKPLIPMLVHPEMGFKDWPPRGPMGPLMTGKLYVDMNQVENLGQLVEAIEARLSAVTKTKVVLKAPPPKPVYNRNLQVVSHAANQQWNDMMNNITAGGDPNEIELASVQYTPLLYAAYHQNKAMFSWLTQHGADVTYRDTNGKTALHVAAKYGSPDIVRLLLLEGCDYNIRDVFGRIAADLTTDRRQVAKAVDDSDLQAVQRVFRCWPQIEPVYHKEGEPGLHRLMAGDDPDLSEEARLCIEELNSRPAGTPEASEPAAAPEAKQANDGEVDVFLSYCWANKELVRPLAEQLRARGYKVWLDVGQMGAGDALFDAIDQGIRGCKVVITSLSAPYARSVNCRRELSLSNDVRKPILPILVDSSLPFPPPGPMGPLLTGHSYVNITSLDDDSLNQLLNRLTVLLQGGAEVQSGGASSEAAKLKGEVQQVAVTAANALSQLTIAQERANISQAAVDRLQQAVALLHEAGDLL